MLDAQRDQQLIFAAHLGTSNQTLHALTVAQPLDDTVFAAHQDQTLWVSDPSSNSVYSVTGPFTPGQAISTVSPDTGATSLAALDLGTGSLTPVPELASIHPKGLLFTGSRDEDHGSRTTDHGPHVTRDQQDNHNRYAE